MIDRIATIQNLKNASLDELFEKGRKILFDKKLKIYGTDAFQLKKLILDELRRRDLLVIRIDSGKGSPPRTNTVVLGGNETNTILQRCCYVKEKVECVVREGGGPVKFLEKVTA